MYEKWYFFGGSLMKIHIYLVTSGKRKKGIKEIKYILITRNVRCITLNGGTSDC
jgi:hypothetical protein